MNPGTYACAGFEKSASCSGNSMASSPGIPISMARVGDKGTVVSISGREETKRFLAGLGFSISGREETKRFLAGLGFTPGTEVRAVSEASGNVILDVKGSKIAIDRKMASKILFCPES